MLKTSEITADQIFNNKYNKTILLDMVSSDAIMDEDAIIQMSLYSNNIYDIYDAFTDDTDTLEEWLETIKGEYNPNAEYHILFKDDTFDPWELISTDYDGLLEYIWNHRDTILYCADLNKNDPEIETFLMKLAIKR